MVEFNASSGSTNQTTRISICWVLCMRYAMCDKPAKSLNDILSIQGTMVR